MSLDIRQREREGIRILDLDGRIRAGEEAAALGDAVKSAIDEGAKNLILNLEKVEYIDSTGLGRLVVCYTSLRKVGGAVKLLNVNKRNIELLVYTKLATVFEFFKDEQDAVNSFFPDREIHRFDILDFVREQNED